MTRDLLDRALGYPYPLPGASYIVHRGEVRPFEAEDAPRHRAGRTAVLAVGSNQSPVQIARKFHEPHWGPVPCERCVLADFDTVYSAHVTAYGSVAATLHPSPGTRVTLYVNWLDEAQLDRMHDTELGNENYAYARLDGIDLETELGLALNTVHFYRGNAGAYAPASNPVPLAEVDARNRRWRALRQTEMQALVHAWAGPDHAFEEFVLHAIENRDERQRRTTRMRKTAHPFEHAGLSILKT